MNKPALTGDKIKTSAWQAGASGLVLVGSNRLAKIVAVARRLM